MAMGENPELTSSYEHTESTAAQGITSYGGVGGTKNIKLADQLQLQ